uniref:Uncharacterized protein n=1 Tax=Romanomermis culicivorax TaxID=13658 RepID=A0A915KEX6_ROMCU
MTKKGERQMDDCFLIEEYTNMLASQQKHKSRFQNAMENLTESRFASLQNTASFSCCLGS